MRDDRTQDINNGRKPQQLSGAKTRQEIVKRQLTGERHDNLLNTKVVRVEMVQARE